jgi:hypothetical protein
MSKIAIAMIVAKDPAKTKRAESSATKTTISDGEQARLADAALLPHSDVADAVLAGTQALYDAYPDAPRRLAGDSPMRYFGWRASLCP